MTPTRDEMMVLARHAGIHLDCIETLVAVYPLVRAMVARLPAALPRGDEPAQTFDPTRFEPSA